MNLDESHDTEATPPPDSAWDTRRECRVQQHMKALQIGGQLDLLHEPNP